MLETDTTGRRCQRRSNGFFKLAEGIAVTLGFHAVSARAGAGFLLEPLGGPVFMFVLISCLIVQLFIALGLLSSFPLGCFKNPHFSRIVHLIV